MLSLGLSSILGLTYTVTCTSITHASNHWFRSHFGLSSVAILALLLPSGGQSGFLLLSGGKSAFMLPSLGHFAFLLLSRGQSILSLASG